MAASSSTRTSARPRDPERRVSLEAHRVAEWILGLLLIMAPVILNFQIAGFILCAGAGMLIGGLGFAATRSGRQLSGVPHRTADYAAIALLVVAGLLSAAVNTTAGPTVTLFAAAAIQGLLTATTRYAE